LLTPEERILLFPSVVNQLTTALRSVHQAGFVHGDLKDTNIVCNLTKEDGEQRIELALIDFGGVYKIGRRAPPHDIVSLTHRPPEYRSLQSVNFINPSLDVWSLGVVLGTFLTGENQAYEQTKKQSRSIIQKRIIDHDEVEWKTEHPDFLVGNYIAGIKQLTKFNYQDRPKMMEDVRRVFLDLPFPKLPPNALLSEEAKLPDLLQNWSPEEKIVFYTKCMDALQLRKPKKRSLIIFYTFVDVFLLYLRRTSPEERQQLLEGSFDCPIVQSILEIIKQTSGSSWVPVHSKTKYDAIVAVMGTLLFDFIRDYKELVSKYYNEATGVNLFIPCVDLVCKCELPTEQRFLMYESLFGKLPDDYISHVHFILQCIRLVDFVVSSLSCYDDLVASACLFLCLRMHTVINEKAFINQSETQEFEKYVSCITEIAPVHNPTTMIALCPNVSRLPHDFIFLVALYFYNEPVTVQVEHLLEMNLDKSVELKGRLREFVKPEFRFLKRMLLL
jgi:serine/threonine protein kinase